MVHQNCRFHVSVFCEAPPRLSHANYLVSSKSLGLLNLRFYAMINLHWGFYLYPLFLNKRCLPHTNDKVTLPHHTTFWSFGLCHLSPCGHTLLYWWQFGVIGLSYSWNGIELSSQHFLFAPSIVLLTPYGVIELNFIMTSKHFLCSYSYHPHKGSLEKCLDT